MTEYQPARIITAEEAKRRGVYPLPPPQDEGLVIRVKPSETRTCRCGKRSLDIHPNDHHFFTQPLNGICENYIDTD